MKKYRHGECLRALVLRVFIYSSPVVASISKSNPFGDDIQVADNQMDKTFTQMFFDCDVENSADLS